MNKYFPIDFRDLTPPLTSSLSSNILSVPTMSNHEHCSTISCFCYMLFIITTDRVLKPLCKLVTTIMRVFLSSLAVTLHILWLIKHCLTLLIVCYWCPSNKRSQNYSTRVATKYKSVSLTEPTGWRSSCPSSTLVSRYTFQPGGGGFYSL